MTADIHTRSYYCERPGCVRAQWDELRDRLEAVLAQQPPSAPVGVDFAAVASILRRAMRDGVHYGYRRDFILQQALALEALSQQPAAVDGACAAAAIQFALNDPEGMTFLRLWNEGEFDTLRREWPDAPSTVYVGADPLATNRQEPTP